MTIRIGLPPGARSRLWRHFGQAFLAALCLMLVAFALPRAAQAETQTHGHDAAATEAAAALIWSTVPATSVVRVLVMVWTLIGASPPTRTLPTRIWRDLRR